MTEKRKPRLNGGGGSLATTGLKLGTFGQGNLQGFQNKLVAHLQQKLHMNRLLLFISDSAKTKQGKNRVSVQTSPLQSALFYRLRRSNSGEPTHVPPSRSFKFLVAMELSLSSNCFLRADQHQGTDCAHHGKSYRDPQHTPELKDERF